MLIDLIAKLGEAWPLVAGVLFSIGYVARLHTIVEDYGKRIVMVEGKVEAFENEREQQYLEIKEKLARIETILIYLQRGS